MYVCVCHAFTDGAVRPAAPACDGTVAGLYRALDVEPTCGKCVPMVRDLVRAVCADRLTAEAATASRCVSSGSGEEFRNARRPPR